MAATIGWMKIFRVNFVTCQYVSPRVIFAGSNKPRLEYVPSRTAAHFQRRLKLPSPHSPVNYPDRWNFPKHSLTPEKVDSYQPSKLLMVRRVQSLRGRPNWEKYIMLTLRLDGKPSDIVILKNSPEMNAMLWRVKHLISVKPITFPNGLPDKGDYTGTYLKHNGQFVVNEKLKVDQQLIKWPEEFERTKLTREYLKHYLLIKWQQKYEV